MSQAVSLPEGTVNPLSKFGNSPVYRSGWCLVILLIFTISRLGSDSLGQNSTSLDWNTITNSTTTNSSIDQSPLKQSTPNVAPCALLFFGVPRLFQSVVLPSIQKYIVQVNPTCDIFVHTYNQTVINTNRSGESHGRLDPKHVYQLTNHVYVESMESFYPQRNLTWFRQHHHQGWGPCCESTDNMIKQWHSIQGVWNLMEQHGELENTTYERVGLFRSDVFYTTPIDISDRTELAIVPNWSYRNRKRRDREFLNDRMFYGIHANARVWATERFPTASWYVQQFQDEHRGFRQGIHSETFLFHLMVKFSVKEQLRKKPICFWRTRATGMIMSIDCMVPNPEDGSDGTIQDSEDWALLSKYQCCWGCKSDTIRDDQWGPCTPGTFGEEKFVLYVLVNTRVLDGS